MAGLLDTCIICGHRSNRPGSGICLQHEIMALIDLSFDRIRAALRGEIPVIGRRLQPSQAREGHERMSSEKMSKAHGEM